MNKGVVNTGQQRLDYDKSAHQGLDTQYKQAIPGTSTQGQDER